MNFGDIVVLTKNGIHIPQKHLDAVGAFPGSTVTVLPMRTFEYRTSEPAHSAPLDIFVTPIPVDAWPYCFKFTARLHYLPDTLQRALQFLEKQGINIISSECTRSGHHHSVLNVIGEMPKLRNMSVGSLLHRINNWYPLEDPTEYPKWLSVLDWWEKREAAKTVRNTNTQWRPEEDYFPSTTQSKKHSSDEVDNNNKDSTEPQEVSNIFGDPVWSKLAPYLYDRYGSINDISVDEVIRGELVEATKWIGFWRRDRYLTPTQLYKYCEFQNMPIKMVFWALMTVKKSIITEMVIKAFEENTAYWQRAKDKRIKDAHTPPTVFLYNVRLLKYMNAHQSMFWGDVGLINAWLGSDGSGPRRWPLEFSTPADLRSAEDRDEELCPKPRSKPGSEAEGLSEGACSREEGSGGAASACGSVCEERSDPREGEPADGFEACQAAKNGFVGGSVGDPKDCDAASSKEGGTGGGHECLGKGREVGEDDSPRSINYMVKWIKELLSDDFGGTDGRNSLMGNMDSRLEMSPIEIQPLETLLHAYYHRSFESEIDCVVQKDLVVIPEENFEAGTALGSLFPADRPSTMAVLSCDTSAGSLRMHPVSVPELDRMLRVEVQFVRKCNRTCGVVLVNPCTQKGGEDIKVHLKRFPKSVGGNCLGNAIGLAGCVLGGIAGYMERRYNTKIEIVRHVVKTHTMVGFVEKGQFDIVIKASDPGFSGFGAISGGEIKNDLARLVAGRFLDSHVSIGEVLASGLNPGRVFVSMPFSHPMSKVWLETIQRVGKAYGFHDVDTVNTATRSVTDTVVKSLGDSRAMIQILAVPPDPYCVERNGAGHGANTNPGLAWLYAEYLTAISNGLVVVRLEETVSMRGADPHIGRDHYTSRFSVNEPLEKFEEHVRRAFQEILAETSGGPNGV